LRIRRQTDIDSQQMMLRVDQGRGRKDRYVMLSPRLLDELRAYWKAAHPIVWLFPGDLPGQPITRDAVRASLPESAPCFTVLPNQSLRTR
jgi:integrase